MTQFELEQGLNALRKDLFAADSMDEATACRVYNVDCKADIIEVIKEEIATYETILSRSVVIEDSGMDYDALCDVQGLSRYA
ncbi:hypothetical protein ACIXOC_20470 [Bacteroides fragilis]|jgi:hypothetical protein